MLKQLESFTPMENANLLELAGRCEAATGTDRELDRAILDAVFGKAIGCWWLGSDKYQFTASLDAAMTLVPEGFDHYGFDRNLDGDILSAPHVTTQAFLDGGASDFSQYFRAEAATPALALCAAALRARAAA